jgi:hypothetical protein
MLSFVVVLNDLDNLLPREMFHDILRLIARLWAPPAPA